MADTMSGRTVRQRVAIVILAVSLASVTIAPALTGAAQGQGGAKGAPRAVIKTKYGDMEIKFFPQAAPKHVENFVKLAKSGFYTGTIFHRVIPGFMIQGGDPNTKDPNKKETYGMGGPGYSLKAEFNDIPHKRGVVSMARAQDPDSAGSQFFIVVEDSPFLDHKYTVFGEVVRGMGVADKIVNVPRDPRDMPLDRIEMTMTVTE